MAVSEFKIVVRRKKGQRIGKAADRLHAELKKLWKYCISQSILAQMSNIQVDTGMSMASLYGAASQVKLGSIVMGAASGGLPKRMHPLPSSWDFNYAKYKSATLGRELGQRVGSGRYAAYEIDFGTPKKLILKYRFNIMVYQYWLWENGFVNAKKGKSAWHTIDNATKAFNEAWISGVKTLNFAKYAKEWVLELAEERFVPAADKSVPF